MGKQQRKNWIFLLLCTIILFGIYLLPLAFGYGAEESVLLSGIVFFCMTEPIQRLSFHVPLLFAMYGYQKYFGYVHIFNGLTIIIETIFFVTI